MRVHFLPAEQEKRNDKLIEKLRRMGYLLFLLLMATVALGTELYLWLPAARVGTQLTSDEGQGGEWVAVVLAPELILAPARMTGTGQFITPRERINAHSINSTKLPDGTYITLLRLDKSTSAEPISVVVVDPGEGLVATGSGQEWHGSARAQTNGLYPVDPAFNLSAGTPVYRDSDRTSLVGFAVSTASGSAIVSAQEIVNRFPQANSGR